MTQPLGSGRYDSAQAKGSTAKGPRDSFVTLKRWLAGLTSFFLAVGGIYFGLDFAMPQAQAAPTPTARLIQVLGHFDKFFTGNGTDSEFRLDFVLEVPTGSIKSNGSGLDLYYDYYGTYTGPVGNGIRATGRGSGTWLNAGQNRITTTNLAVGDINQQYRIIRIDNFGAVDRVTLSMQGDLAYMFDRDNPSGTGAPSSYPVTMQAVVTVNGSPQYVSYQYQTTLYNVARSYDSQFRGQKIAPILPYDYVYETGFNSQTNWGYVVNDANPTVPANRMYVSFISPWMGNTSAQNAGVCTEAKSFYYQWLRNDGTPTTLTPTPVLKSINPMPDYTGWIGGRSAGRVVDIGPIDFSSEGPGYYQLVAWPIATNPTRSPATNCSDYSYYTDSVGDISAANAFTMGSVFYTGANEAAAVNKSFSLNPMPYQGTSSAVFTLDSGNARISGVGFTDTFPSGLYLTGKILKDTCGLETQTITSAQLAAITSPDILANVQAGPLLQLVDSNSDGKLDTVKVQGGVSYNIQTGGGEVIGTTIPRGGTCTIEVEVKHADTITGNSVCANSSTPTAQTNDSTNVSYTSLSTVLSYDAKNDDAFGECLSITMQSDLSPTGVTKNVLPGSTLPLSSTVTNAGPSEIDNAQVVITAPTGTTLTNVTTGCVLSAGNTVATCATGRMNAGATLTYNYSVVVPSSVPLGTVLNGTVKTVYAQDKVTANDSAAITLTAAGIGSAASQFSVSSAGIVADGRDTGTITATLVDTTGSPMTGMADIIHAWTMLPPDGATTFSSFTETGVPGTYTATVSSTLIGNKAVGVTAGGGTVAISGNNIANFIPGPLYSSYSTFRVSPVVDPTDQTNWRTANGSDFYFGILTARDEYNNPIANLNVADIAFTSSSSDVVVSSVTNVGGGAYSVKYTSVVADSTVQAFVSVGAKMIGAGGEPIPFKPGPAVPGPVVCSKPGQQGTNLSVSPSQLGVGETSVVTALITDAQCNPVPNATVDFSLEAGTAGVLTVIYSGTDANGIAMAIVTDNVAEIVKVHAKLATVDIDGSEQDIEFMAGVADATQSSLSLNPTTAVVGNTITATARVADALGNPLPGRQVTLTLTGDATFGNPGDPKVQTTTCKTGINGQCSVSVTDATAETVDVRARIVIGTALVDVAGSPAAATFTAGPPATTCSDPNNPSAEKPNVSASPTSLMVGSSSTVRAYVTDSYCNPIDGVTVNFGVDGSARLGGTSKTTVAGVATTTVTDNVAEIAHVTAQVGRLSLPGSAVAVAFSTRGVNPSNSLFTVSPSSPVVADGVAAYTGTFTARDSYGNALPGLALADIVFGSSSGSVNVSSPVVDNGDGTYTVKYTSTVASSAYTATLNYKTSKIGSDEPIPFIAGAPVAANSSLWVAPVSVGVGGTSTATVTLRDANNNLVGGARAGLAVTGNASLSNPSCMTSTASADFGTCRVTLTDNTAEIVTVTATLGSNTIPVPTDVEFAVGGVSSVYSDITVAPSAQVVGVDVTVTVKARDSYDNPVGGLAAGNFVVTTSNDKGAPVLVLRDFTPLADGVYTFKTTSEKVATFTFSAKVSGATLTQHPTASFTHGGTDAGKSFFVMTVNDQLADGVAQDKAVAHANDVYGNPVPGASVRVIDQTTGVNAGILNPANRACTTGVDGTCELSWTATKVGTYTGQGTIDLLSPSDGTGILNQIRFSSGKSSPEKSDLVVTPTTVMVGQTSTATVTVRDASGVLVPGAVVSFSLEDTLSDLPDGTKAPWLSELYCQTGSLGTCSVTLTSQIAGQTKVHATLPSGGVPTGLGGNGDAVKASPQTVTFTPAAVCYPSAGVTCSPTAELRTRVEVTVNGQEANGSAQDVATAYAFDKWGNPVPGTAVQTTTVDADLVRVTPSTTTGVDGSTTLRYTSTVAGSHDADVVIGGVVPQGSPLTLTFGSGAVVNATLTLSPVGPLKVDETYTLTVKTTDATGNNVSGAVVTFGVPGDVTVTGPGVASCTTSASGECAITVTTTKAGFYDVSASMSGVTVLNSPRTLVFEAEAVCAEADGCIPDPGAAKTEVVLTVTGQLADGVSPDVAVVHAYDKHGNPVKGAVVTSSAWFAANLRVVTPIAPTGVDGSTTIQYTSSVAGGHLADVWVDGKTPVGSPVNPAFAAGIGDPHTSTWAITPAGPLVVGDGVGATYTATTTVRDAAKNPVAGAIVTIVSAQPGVTFPGGVTCTTNASGVCSVPFYSTVSGTFEFSALLGPDQIQTALSRAWQPDVVCAEASGCLPVDPSTPPEKRTRIKVTTNGVIADGAQRDIVTVYSFDKWGNPVSGALVKSTTADANLTIQTGIAGTNALGTTTIWYSSTQAGNHDALVTVDGKIPANGKDGTGSVTLNFAPGSAVGQKSTLTVAPATLPAGDDATATATVRDINKNPVPGVVVTFGKTGSAVLSATRCTTTVDGTCSVTLTDTVTEIVQVRATIQVAGVATPITGSPASVTFTNACIPGKDPGCTYDPAVDDDHRTRVEVTTNFQVENGGVDVATVYYFDRYGNPVTTGVVATSHAVPTLSDFAPRVGAGGRGQTEIDYTSTTSGAFQAAVTIDGVAVVFQPVPGGPHDNPASIAAKSSPVTLNFVDVTTPAAPIILHPSNGDLTNNRPLVVDGTAEPGSELTVVDRTTGGTICTTTVNAAGNWTCSVNLSDGDHTLVAHSVDPSGNRSPDSPLVKVKVDTVAPGAPTVDTANGTEVAGNPGSSEPDAIIEVTWPDGSTSATTVNPDGSWSIPTPPGMGSGEIGVTATDPADNTSGETKVDLDAVPPSVPVVDTANGTEVGGNPGSSEPGATIEVTWPDGTTDTTTVNPDGSWTIPTPPGTPSGTIEVTATDPAGNTSGEAKANLDTNGPGAPVVDPSDGTVVTGKTEPGATVTITGEDGNSVVCQEGVIVAGADGGFRCTPVTPLLPDTVIDVVATDKAGNSSKPEEEVIGELGIRAKHPMLLAGEEQIVIGTGFIPGETVTLDFCSSTCTRVGTGVADASGKVEITFQIPEGTHSGSHIVRLTGDQSGPYMGSVETTFVLTVKVETGGSVTTSSASPGAATALLLLARGVAVVPTPLRKKEVGA